jgi:HAD superfamily hydrolase (TIGR01549 family)
MEFRGLIFDLDMTLVDTSCLESLRQQRQWQNVYSSIPDTVLYPGVRELISELTQKYVSGVVTSSPRSYAEKVLEYHSLSTEVLVAYHDTSYHKPHPAPFIMACQKLGIPPSQIVSIGDQENDYLAAQAAGLAHYHAGWAAERYPTLPEALNCPSIIHLRDVLNMK